MNELVVQGLHKAFDTQLVLEDFDLTVEAGLVHLHPRAFWKWQDHAPALIAGFERADEAPFGFTATSSMTQSHFVESSARRIGYVPQDGSLFPHLSVKANVGFGLRAGTGTASASRSS